MKLNADLHRFNGLKTNNSKAKCGGSAGQFEFLNLSKTLGAMNPTKIEMAKMGKKVNPVSKCGRAKEPSTTKVRKPAETAITFLRIMQLCSHAANNQTRSLGMIEI